MINGPATHSGSHRLTPSLILSPFHPGWGTEVPEQVPNLANLCSTATPIIYSLGPQTSPQCLSPDALWSLACVENEKSCTQT